MLRTEVVLEYPKTVFAYTYVLKCADGELYVGSTTDLKRRLTKLPPFPPTMSKAERFIASSSEKLLYTLMIAMPLIGWGMLSAGHYPIEMFGAVHLPPILPAHPLLFAILRHAHTILAYLLFATIFAHVGAILFHTLIVRDHILDRMALWPVRPPGPPDRNQP